MTDWKTYQNLAAGFSLTYPPNWSHEEDPSGSIVIFTAKDKGDVGDLSEPAVNVITQDAENQTLEEFTKKTLEQMKKIPNFPSETLKVEDAQLGGERAKKCLYVATVEDENLIQFYQIWTIKNNTAFIITVSCAQENFDKYLNLMTKILKSFTFIKQKKPMKHILLKTFVKTKEGFAIKIPVSWKETTEKDAEKKGYVARWEFGSQKEQFKLSLHVAVDPLPQPNMTLSDYLDVVLLQHEKLLPVGMKLFVKDTKLDDEKAKQIRFQSHAFNNNEKFVQVIGIKKNKIYTVTFRSQVTENDSRPYTIFKRSLASFKFLVDDQPFSEDPTLLTIENLIHKFKIQFDSYFTPKEDFLGMTLALIKTSEIPNIQNQLLATPTHLAIVVRDVKESNITLEEMREELKTQTMQLASETGQASKIKITLDESTTIDSVPGHILVFEGPGQNGTPTTVLQKFALKDQMAILISFTAVSKNWKKEMEAAKKVIDSFRFF